MRLSVPTTISLAVLLGAAVLAPDGVAAQVPADGVIEIRDPAPPTGGAPINQGGQAGATIRAFRVDQPLDIDGVLDESFYSRVQPISEFVQGVPVEDGTPSERTEAWIGFDDENVYVDALR